MRGFLNRLWEARRAVVLYATLLALGWIAGELLRHAAIPEMRPMNEPLIHRIVMGALVVFILAAAIPFVPGAEIGFALLLLFGGQAAPIVYSGMVGALMLSYSVARFVPLGALAGLARRLGLRRLAASVGEFAAVPTQERAAMVADRLSGRFSQALMRKRYVVLALALNTPGNSVIGGGGGIAFLAGVSGLYGFWPYLLSVLIAVAPFPLAFYLTSG